MLFSTTGCVAPGGRIPRKGDVCAYDTSPYFSGLGPLSWNTKHYGWLESVDQGEVSRLSI